MKNNDDKSAFQRECIIWIGVALLTVAVFAVIAVSSPLLLSNVKSDGASTITIVRATSAPTESADTFQKVNLNTADYNELLKVPGIGDVLAHRIIAYRDVHGSFASVEEVCQVEGIGSARFEQIKTYLTV